MMNTVATRTIKMTAAHYLKNYQIEIFTSNKVFITAYFTLNPFQIMPLMAIVVFI